MYRLSRALLAALVLLALGASPALAQDDFDDDDTTTSDGGLFGASSSTSTTTALGVSVTVGPFITTTLVAGGAVKTSELEQYIRHNSAALAQDIQVGGGETVNDLANLFHIAPAQRHAFGTLLRAQRAAIVPLTNPAKLNHDRTRAFVLQIFGAMQQDARFASSVASIKRLS